MDIARIDTDLCTALFENVVDGIVLINEHGIIQAANPAVQELFGYPATQLIGQNVSVLMPAPYKDEHDDYLRRYRETGERRIIGIGREVRGRRRDGSIFPLYLSVAEMKLGGKTHFAGLLHDLSALRQAEREMLRMRSYLKNMIDSMPSVMLGIDTEGRITEWNLRAEQVTGIAAAQATGRAFQELVPELSSQVERVHQAITERRALTTERLESERDGELRFADVMVYPLVANGTQGAVIRVDDVTQRVRIEQLMVQTEKMMSVGGLAAGMAHEINNPLSAVLQGCQNIERRLSPELVPNQRVAAANGIDVAAVHRYVQEREILAFLAGIREAATRASHIVTDMLAFSRRSDARFQPNRLDEMLEAVVRLAASDYDLRRRYDFRRVAVQREYEPEVPAVECDRTGIEQVFLNIIKNAAHAMAEADIPQHRLILRIRRAGAVAEVEVQDNGPGVPEGSQARVFEPFFTTKPPGIGTGLGLSVSYFIVVDQHGGSLSLTCPPGQGTCFLIRLPITARRP